MPDLGGDTVWVAASFLLAIVLAAVLVGVAQLVIASRCEEESQRTPWRAMITIAMLAGSLAVGIGVAAEGVIAAIAGAALGVRFAWRHDFRGSPQHVALRGSGVGLAAMLGGFARYLSSTSCGEWACAEVYAAVFVGARGRASGYERGQSNGAPALRLDGLRFRDRTRATVRAGCAAGDEPARDRLGRPSDDERGCCPWTLCIRRGVGSAFDGSLRRCAATQCTQYGGRLRMAGRSHACAVRRRLRAILVAA